MKDNVWIIFLLYFNVFSVSTFQTVPHFQTLSLPKHVLKPISLEKKPTILLYDSFIEPSILQASFGATCKLLSSISLGLLVSPIGPKYFNGVLDSLAVSSLSKLSFYIVQPLFLLSNVALTLAASANRVDSIGTSNLFLLSIAAIVQIGAGAGVGMLISSRKLRSKLLGIDEDSNPDNAARDVTMCTAFANSGPLPLIFANAVFPKGDVLADVTACVSSYLMIWSPLFWAIGKLIVGSRVDDRHVLDEESILLKLRRNTLQLLRLFFNPPAVGSLLGYFIGRSSPIVRDTFIKPTGYLYPIFSAMSTIGSSYIPSSLLVLAGSLAAGKKSIVQESDKLSKGKNDTNQSTIRSRTIISILFSRFVLSPLFALTTIQILTRTKLLPLQNPRSVAIISYSMLMGACMPPAQNIVMMLQLTQEKQRAAKMAKVLTVIYSLSVIPVTLLLSGCLSLSGIMKYL